MADYGEPWTCHNDSVVESEVTIHDALRYERLNSEKGCQTDWAVENFPRIVACVNACRGLDQAMLERVVYRHIADPYFSTLDDIKRTMEIALGPTNQHLEDMASLLRENGFEVHRKL